MDISCIFCDDTEGSETVEHIIPQSLGNVHYILPKGKVCYNCNNRFARFENKVVSSKIFVEERKRLGVINPNAEYKIVSLNNQDLRKLMLKMGYEGLFMSRPGLWKKYQWSEIKGFLINGEPSDIFEENEYPDKSKFRSIPRWINRLRLRNNHLSLEFLEVNNKVFVRFQFGRLRSEIRMV